MKSFLKFVVVLFVLDASHANGEGPLLDDTPPTKPPEGDDSLLSNTDSLPIFLIEPADAFVIKSKPATLHCRAANSLQIYFKCNGAKNIQSFQSEFVDPQTGIRIVDAECNVTRNMVEEFFGKDKFKCECYAWSGRGQIKSQSATIEVAYLKKQFSLPPVSTRVELGQQTELRCVPPEGLPPPRVYWTRGDTPLQTDTTMLVTSEGHLLLGQARERDTGNYTCVAENIAAKRKANPAKIVVYDLKKQFSLPPVSTRVELGQQTELRCVPPEGLPPPRVYWTRGDTPLQTDTTMLVTSEGHLLLGQARERDTGNYTCVAENIAAKRKANPAQIVVYVNGGWSVWSSWQDCKCPGSSPASGQKRTRTCTSPAPSNGGLPCQGPSVHRTPDCLPCPPVNGGWSVWSSWQDCKCPGSSPASGQKRTRTCSSPAPSNGGLPCQGPSVHRTPDCLPCPPVEPRWSAWSDWSDCSPECTRTRRRHCIPPPPAQGGQPPVTRHCTGKDSQVSPCPVDQCQPTADVREATLADTQTDLALYIGLSVALTLVTVLSFFLVRVYYRKGQHQSLYNMAANEYHPEYFPEHDKKSLSLQPDLTQTVPPCYEYPYTKPVSSTVTRSVSEHHYDVPHLASASDIQMSPATSSTLESSSGKRSQLSGFTNGSDSTYEVATESVTLPLPALPTAYAVTPTTSGNYTSALITHSGGYLNLPENGVSLLIPEGCISRSRKHDIFLSILNEDCFRPKLNDNLTQLSPVVSCGPNISLNKPVILNMPHCADMKRNDWSISVLMSDCSDAQWQSVVTLGQETINTPVFCQLDTDAAYLITDSLSRFVLVGQSLKGSACKRLKLAVFAPKLCFQSSVDYSIRVYVLEDTESSMETVFSQEKRLGGFLMDDPKSLLFQDGGNNLCLTLDNISEGWKAKPSSNYQEIPFRHLWQASSNTLHCSFTLEAYEVSHNLNFTIRANQYTSDSFQTFDITVKDQDITNHSSKKTSNSAPSTQKYSVQNENPKTHKTLPQDDFNSSKCAKNFKNLTQDDFRSGKSLIVTDKGVSTCDDFVFRLNKQARKQLCQCLDPPITRGNDWRMLAHALSVDRYINYFATKPSPTDCILDLWEARHRQSNAMTDLIQIFRDMDRYDAVSIIDNCLGPNWL